MRVITESVSSVFFVTSGAFCVARVSGWKVVIHTDQRKHGHSSQQRAQLHYSSTPHEGAVAFITEDHPNNHLHIGQGENKEDPGQHLWNRSRWVLLCFCLSQGKEVQLVSQQETLWIVWVTDVYQCTHNDNTTWGIINQHWAWTQHCHDHNINSNSSANHCEGSHEQQGSVKWNKWHPDCSYRCSKVDIMWHKHVKLWGRGQMNYKGIWH